MKIKKFFSLIICFVIIISAINVNAFNFIVKSVDTDNGEQVSDFYDRLIDYIVKTYKYDITRDELLTAAAKSILKEHPELLVEFGKGAFEALDENSEYYTFDEYTDVYSTVSGYYVGIGVHVLQSAGRIILGEPIEGTPAASSGLMVGDIIIAVDGENVKDYSLDKIVSMIQGEIDTEVSITVLRDKNEYTYKIKRTIIEINPVTYNIIEDTNFGYVKISSFNASTMEGFDTAMKYFHDNDISKVVLDLRNNLGGYLDAAVGVASYFIPDGKLVVTEEHKDETKNIKHYANKTIDKFRAVVLINEYSASASEVVASALRDYGTGVLVGKTSFGKGTVQVAIPVKSADVLWLTEAEYYTPNHAQIHKVGIDPDYFVSNPKEEFDMSSLTKYEITRVLQIGDSGEDVYAVKERLSKIGYSLNLDDVYDERTAEVVEHFQESTELFPYGVADITTQIKINDILRTSYVTVDKQFDKAVELLNEIF
ncbi:MAG: S41 family peptidase [Clostridia bacterium]|nr:S41 family peptidase [Clostridia bacterium]